MKAMQLAAPRVALKLVNLPTPRPGRGQLLIKVRACAKGAAPAPRCWCHEA